MADFRRGHEAAKADADSGGGLARRVQYWNIKENESEVLRFLTDAPEWFVVRQHTFFPTKPAPADAKKWPAAMTAVCRKDPAFAGEYSSCPLCEAIKDNDLKGYGGKGPMKTRSMVFALAVRRERVVCDGSEAMGGPAKKGKKATRDFMVELDELDEDGKATGEKREVPDIRIISNTMYSLFNNLRSAYETYDSVVDRDFVIKREKAPNGTGTVHTAVGLDLIPALQPGEPRWKTYTEALDFYGLDLGTMLEEQASDEFYNRFFLGEDGRAIVPKKSGGSAESSTSSGTVDNDEEYQATLDAVKNRLKSNAVDFA